MSAPLTTTEITIEVNGISFERTLPVRLLLSDFLRHHLGLTGTHVGCEHGVCGACNVQLDGQLIRSCLMLAVQADRRSITTIEGLSAHRGALHPAQRALAAHHGLQCGYCTPGVVMTLADLADRATPPTDNEICDELSGNLCRCTGYQGILAAAHDLLAPTRESEEDIFT